MFSMDIKDIPKRYRELFQMVKKQKKVILYEGVKPNYVIMTYKEFVYLKQCEEELKKIKKD